MRFIWRVAKKHHAHVGGETWPTVISTRSVAKYQHQTKGWRTATGSLASVDHAKRIVAGPGCFARLIREVVPRGVESPTRLRPEWPEESLTKLWPGRIEATEPKSGNIVEPGRRRRA